MLKEKKKLREGKTWSRKSFGIQLSHFLEYVANGYSWYLDKETINTNRMPCFTSIPSVPSSSFTLGENIKSAQTKERQSNIQPFDCSQEILKNR